MWFPLNLILNTHFLLAQFALYPFTLKNLSCARDYMLSPVNPPSEPSNLGVVLETPDTVLFQGPCLTLFAQCSLLPSSTFVHSDFPLDLSWDIFTNKSF